MSDLILEVDDQNFETSVLQSDKPVLVDFWAPWCGPCKAIGPIVEALAGQYQDEVAFTKCNIDNNPVTPEKFGIKAIPTILFFKGGQLVEMSTGFVGRDKLEQAIKRVLEGKPATQPFVVR